MNGLSVGDLSQHFQSLRQNGITKDRLLTLTQELSTGQKSDMTAELKGDVGRLLSLDREIEMFDSFKQNTVEVAQVQAMMQNALETIDVLRERQSSISLPITVATSRPIVESAAKSSTSAFTEMVATLNRQLGDKSLFAGVQTDGAAFEDASLMMADIVGTIGPSPTTSDVIAAVDFWFDDPAGGFATMGYIGDTGAAAERRIGPTQSASYVVTGQSEGVKDVLHAIAYGAAADALAGTITTEQQTELLKKSGVDLLSAATTLNGTRSELGASEAFVAEKKTEYETQLTALRIMRNDMTTADPFETALRLQEVQQQLETQFAVTARLSGLSLANYI